MKNKLFMCAILCFLLYVTGVSAQQNDRDTLYLAFNAQWDKGNPLTRTGEHTSYGVGVIKLLSDRNNANLVLEWNDKEIMSFDLERDVTIYNDSRLGLEIMQKGLDKGLTITLKHYFSLFLNPYGLGYDKASETRYPGFVGFMSGGTKASFGYFNEVYYTTDKSLSERDALLLQYVALSNHRDMQYFMESIILGTHPYFRVKQTVGGPVTQLKGKLTIDSTPSGAEVLLGDSLVGYTPFSADDVTIGKYKLTVRKKNFATYTEDVLISKKNPVKRELQLESSIPVEITSNTYSASMLLNDDWRDLPFKGNLAEGTYQLYVPRQYNSWSGGWCRKNALITVDENNTHHHVRLTRDNSYDYAGFIGLDYDSGLQALGLNIGASPSRNFLFELNFFWGLKKSETIYWTGMKTATLNNYDLQQFQYSHWAVDLRMGPTFWCGPFLRIAPELGVQYLHLRESAVGDKNTMDHLFTGAYFSGLASVRFRFGLTQHLGLQITPEYRLNVFGKKMLPDACKDVDRWINGASVKMGLVYYMNLE